jgi:type II secretory pathway pseudopilin PulG
MKLTPISDPPDAFWSAAGSAAPRRFGTPGDNPNAVSSLRSATAVHNSRALASWRPGVSRPFGRASGFTMVEIALCLAIIGFALVAIIGVLPAGLNVQRENREETIIVHEANYFIEAIRAGSRGLDDLTNYVEAITNYVTAYDDKNNIVSGPDTHGYTYARAAINTTDKPEFVLTNGARIIGLLSTPKYLYQNSRPFLPFPSPVHQGFTSNYIVAYVRALSGAAVEKSPQTNSIVRDLAFRYRMICELTPAVNWNTNWTDFTEPSIPPAEWTARSNFWRAAQLVQQNQTELRLIFRWPINGKREAGNQRQVFRTLVGGVFTNEPHRGAPTWFMKSQTYQATR